MKCNHFFRLHREALKQSATDPLTGKVDVGILTSGISAAAKQKQRELATELRKVILQIKRREKKGTESMNIDKQALMNELKEKVHEVRIILMVLK